MELGIVFHEYIPLSDIVIEYYPLKELVNTEVYDTVTVWHDKFKVFVVRQY